jgi:adenylate cyclase
MFSDIRGFTALSATLAPEQVIAVLNAYMSLMIETIARYDGYINKFVGDAIMVVFNVPLDQPDHALRAVACARAMQRELADANARGLFGERLEMGVGINTGSLVAGNLGNERQVEFTVLGDTVNVASRACGKAGAGEVVLTAAAREAAGASAPATSLGRVALKGKGEVELFQLALDDGSYDRWAR